MIPVIAWTNGLQLLPSLTIPCKMEYLQREKIESTPPEYPREVIRVLWDVGKVGSNPIKQRRDLHLCIPNPG